VPKATGHATEKRSKFRTDVQGLRAIAVLLVVLYHSGVGTLSGGFIGVDAFFVISGFLITTHLLESLAADGRISFPAFYARRARRILPAALLVALLTTVAAWLWMPPLALDEVVRGAIATAFYVPNFLFAVQGTDYLAGTSPSVFQHYWSLGIEEQFYLFWPAILAVGFLLCRRREGRLFVLAGVLTLASFLASVLLMSVSTPWTFFGLHTRAWELGVGALIGFLLRSRAAQPLRHPAVGLLAWVGLAALLAGALLYDEATPFPGTAAALPVLATAAMILGGAASGGLHATRLLGLAPFQVVGAISYSLYLVHWPLQIIPQAAVGEETPLPLAVRLGLGAVAFPLAWLLYRFVERPVISWQGLRSRSALWTGAAALAASLALVATAGGVHRAASDVELGTDETVPEAGSLRTDPEGTDFVPENLEPSLEDAADDNPTIYDDDCHRTQASTDASGCRIGEDPEAPLVFLFGDSHAASWYPALAELAEAGEIRLDTNTKSSCPSADVPMLNDGVPYEECDEWRSGVVQRIQDEEPALVLLANHGTEEWEMIDGEDPATQWESGLGSTIQELDGASRVAVLADVPLQGSDPAECLSNNLESASDCDAAVEEALSPEIIETEKAATKSTDAEYLDLTPYFCNERTCPTIIDNLLVYRDEQHLTATFSSHLAEPLEKKIAPLLS
jgi:peptidoglycan/LPS O-acetylase OafA/YrhL